MVHSSVSMAPPKNGHSQGTWVWRIHDARAPTLGRASKITFHLCILVAASTREERGTWIQLSADMQF